MSMEPLDNDDSFVNPPGMQKKIGTNLVKNFSRRRAKDAQPGAAKRALNYSNRNCTATSLNNKIFFIALGEDARACHDISVDI